MVRKSKERKTPPPLKGRGTEGVTKKTDYTEQLQPGPEESYASFAFRRKRQFEMYVKTHPSVLAETAAEDDDPFTYAPGAHCAS